MYRISVILLFISFHCVAQSDTVKRNDIDTKKDNYSGISIGDYSSGDAFYGLPPFFYLEDTLWMELGAHWQYDKTLKAFKTDSSFIHRLSTKYYVLFIGNDPYGAFIDFNKGVGTIVREKFRRRKGKIVAYTAYPLICSDCNIETQTEPYYIFYYDKKGAVVRHGLAYLKKGK